MFNIIYCYEEQCFIIGKAESLEVGEKWVDSNWDNRDAIKLNSSYCIEVEYDDSLIEECEHFRSDGFYFLLLIGT